jgi:rubrerythrin
MTTEKNLKESFAGESQANRKYLAFAAQAEKEGFPGVARLFRATAEAEAIHALYHLKALGGVGSTAENLKAAINGETFEFESMYPPMIDTAKEEGNKTAERAFHLANEAEKVHANVYNKALENLDNLKDADIHFYLCPVCGHIEEGKAPEKCPICGTPGEKYVQY